MSHVFISYKREDNDLAVSLSNRLKDEKINVWVDTDGIYGGNDWSAVIEDALIDSYIVLIIETDLSADSVYVTYEWSFALGHGISVLPIRFEKMRANGIHKRLNDLQPIYLHRNHLNNPDEFNKLINLLKEEQQRSPLDLAASRAIGELHQSVVIHLATLRFVFNAWKIRKSFNNVQDIVRLAVQSNRELNELTYRVVPNFWLTSAHALAVGSKRELRQISLILRKLHHLLSQSLDPLLILAAENIPSELYQKANTDLEKCFHDLFELFHHLMSSFINTYEQPTQFWLLVNDLSRITEQSQYREKDHVEAYLLAAFRAGETLLSPDKFSTLLEIVTHVINSWPLPTSSNGGFSYRHLPPS